MRYSKSRSTEFLSRKVNIYQCASMIYSPGVTCGGDSTTAAKSNIVDKITILRLLFAGRCLDRRRMFERWIPPRFVARKTFYSSLRETIVFWRRFLQGCGGPPPLRRRPRSRGGARNMSKFSKIRKKLKIFENFRIFQKVSKWSEMVRKVPKSYFGVFERFSDVFRCFGVGALYSPCGSRHL